MKTAIPVTISTTLPTAAKAAALASAVVTARLAACAHLIPLRSIYWWQGKLERGAEVAVQFKTRRQLTRALMAFIRERHPYEVPEIVVTPILDGWPDYLAWIDQEAHATPRRLPVHATRTRARRSVPLHQNAPARLDDAFWRAPLRRRRACASRPHVPDSTESSCTRIGAPAAPLTSRPARPRKTVSGMRRAP